MTKRGNLFGPCKDWGKKSRLIHGTRQFVLEEMTGWEKEKRFEAWGGVGTLDKAMYTVMETDSFSTLTQEDLDGMALDGVEYIDTRTVEGMERPMQMLSDWEMGGVKWYQEVPLPEAPGTPSPEPSSGAIEAASQDYAINMSE